MKSRTIVFQTVIHSLLALPQRGGARGLSLLALKKDSEPPLGFVGLCGGLAYPCSRFTHSAEHVS